MTLRQYFVISSIFCSSHMSDSPCKGATHSIMISITHFALQSDSAQSISHIITWFPGGRLRLIDKPIHFLFRWKKAEGDEKARRSQSISKARRPSKIQFTCDKSCSVQSHTDLNKDGKRLSHTGRPFLQVIRNMVNTCSRCMCLLINWLEYACVCLSVCA